MKVKIVLAAAMWQNPHVLILDEPLGGKKSQMGVLKHLECSSMR